VPMNAAKIKAALRAPRLGQRALTPAFSFGSLSRPFGDCHM
jgi:hypothetical protein